MSRSAPCPPFLFLQCRDARRDRHRLYAAGLPNGYSGSPTPILAQVNADYRLAGGRRYLPGELASLKSSTVNNTSDSSAVGTFNL